MDEKELILNNTNLIYDVLKKLKLYNQRDEFYDIGMIGLIKGAKKYDPATGNKPSTYLYRCIYNEIIMCFRKRQVETISLETIVHSNDDNLTIGDMIANDVDIEKECAIAERNKRLYEEISKLKREEQLVLKITFGLDGFNEKAMTQKEIAEYLGITSQVNVSRLKKRALKKLKKALYDLNYDKLK